ncbi:MAG: ORF6N domain-containing protein [Chloroherpetonaceae bacterium]|nr:ORF6N domain-containing protein [Chloroherpetonaceae bacterium]
MTQKQDLIVQERILRSIFVIRNQKVMMDSDLASLYGVETRRLNEQVSRNIDRFPDDFMFQLSEMEWKHLKSQFATSSWGGRRTPPFMFTEQGIAMLSSVLNSPTAIQVNISIMRVYVKMRQWAVNYEDLLKKIDALNQRQMEHSEHIREIYQIIEELVRPAITERKPMGFRKE